MSSARIICFMYQHAKHCIISRETPATPSEGSFPTFSRLPTELRLKIWGEVADQPRTVEITCTPTSSNLPEGRWFSHTTPPHMFRVCSESRQVAIAKYSMLNISPEQTGLPFTVALYFNFSVDTLWLCGDLSAPWARDLLEKNDQLKERLRFVAVSESTWKQINEVEYTPAWTGFAGSWEPLPAPARCGMKALDNVKFHS